jgi:hypothetical protein
LRQREVTVQEAREVKFTQKVFIGGKVFVYHRYT